jgi:hypothetical protein
VKVRAAHLGQGASEAIEAALRHSLGLDLLDRLWSGNEMGEAESIDTTIEAQHATRPRRHL